MNSEVRMSEEEIKRWEENANKGIRENKPNYVLTSSKKLKALNKADIAEKLLIDAFNVFSQDRFIFRELATTIIDRDPIEGLKFADDNISTFGNHARFQKAVALSKLERLPEAISLIEAITAEDKDFREDRFVVSKLVSLYNEEGLFDDATNFLDPLISEGVFTDMRMKQLLATVMIKNRKSPQKVLDILSEYSDPRSVYLKRQANDILALEGASSVGANKPAIIGTPTKQEEREKFSIEGNVFLVHGHNNEAKVSVTRFLEKFGLKVTILHEQPSLGRTIVEKFENYAKVDYAVVLLTGDDIGARKDTPDKLVPRARQNVVLELGYFLGALGREKVCALVEQGVEIPSDFSGVVYVPYDKSNTWQLLLAREIKASGIQIDLNLLMA